MLKTIFDPSIKFQIGIFAPDLILDEWIETWFSSMIYNVKYTLEGFHFKWKNIKGIDAAFPLYITLFSNHLK